MTITWKEPFNRRMSNPLLTRLEAAEPSAQKEIIRAFQNRLYFYFHMRIKGDSPKEDLVQEVLACFFDSVSQGKIHSDQVIAPYIFGIAKRVLYNFYYQSSKNNNMQQKLQQIHSGVQDFEEEKNQETRNLMEGILPILNTLAPIDQKILKRFYFQQDSIGEIATALNRQRHYISVRKDRALKRIRSEMKKRQLL